MPLRPRTVHGRPRRKCPPISLLLLAALALPVGRIDANGPPRGCEPGGPVEVAARMVAVRERGDQAAALVELTIDPLINVSRARIRALQARNGAQRRAPASPERFLPLVSGMTRRLLYEIEVPRGRDHDVFFYVEEAASGRLLEGASAHVRIQLDPARSPRRRAGAIEYRGAVERGRVPGGNPGPSRKRPGP